ncbi:hypothetical protein MPQ_1352 [Methylovorus sp. MP688]|nr:hypothetical protein MPQ_1352 [Methylovorus sp. MP688]
MVFLQLNIVDLGKHDQHGMLTRTSCKALMTRCLQWDHSMISAQ